MSKMTKTKKASYYNDCPSNKRILASCARRLADLWRFMMNVNAPRPCVARWREHREMAASVSPNMNMFCDHFEDHFAAFEEEVNNAIDKSLAVEAGYISALWDHDGSAVDLTGERVIEHLAAKQFETCRGYQFG